MGGGGGKAAETYPACLLPRGHSGLRGPIFAQLSCPWGCRQVGPRAEANNRAAFSHTLWLCGACPDCVLS